MNEPDILTEQNYLTIGQIAEKLQEPVARVGYVVSKYHIKHVRRIGIIRIFSPEQIEAIRQGLYGLQVRTDHAG